MDNGEKERWAKGSEGRVEGNQAIRRGTDKQKVSPSGEEVLRSGQQYRHQIATKTSPNSGPSHLTTSGGVGGRGKRGPARNRGTILWGGERGGSGEGFENSTTTRERGRVG